MTMSMHRSATQQTNLNGGVRDAHVAAGRGHVCKHPAWIRICGCTFDCVASGPCGIITRRATCPIAFAAQAKMLLLGKLQKGAADGGGT